MPNCELWLLYLKNWTPWPFACCGCIRIGALDVVTPSVVAPLTAWIRTCCGCPACCISRGCWSCPWPVHTCWKCGSPLNTAWPPAVLWKLTDAGPLSPAGTSGSPIKAACPWTGCCTAAAFWTVWAAAGWAASADCCCWWCCFDSFVSLCFLSFLCLTRSEACRPVRFRYCWSSSSYWPWSRNNG